MLVNGTPVSVANHGGMSRHNSFTILDPTSGIPSDESFYSFSKTPRLASLTSRHSFEKIPSHGGSTNMASTLAALTGGISNTNPSATITSAMPSRRSELLSLAPLPSLPSASCANINNVPTSQFLSTVKFHAPPSLKANVNNEKRCNCYGIPKICTKVNMISTSPLVVFFTLVTHTQNTTSVSNIILVLESKVSKGSTCRNSRISTPRSFAEIRTPNNCC